MHGFTYGSGEPMCDVIEGEVCECGSDDFDWGAVVEDLTPEPPEPDMDDYNEPEGSL